MAAHSLDTPPAARRPIARRRLRLLLSVVLLFALLWQGVERIINVERYRPLIDSELEKLIRLPLTFGEMDIKLFPTPRLAVANVRAGEGDFSVFAPEVAVTASLGRLFHQQLELHEVTVYDAQLRMPEDHGAFKARWTDYLAALRTPREPKGQSRLRVTLDRIHAPELVVLRGAGTFATGELDVLRVTGGTPEFVYELRGTGDEAPWSARGALDLDMKRDPRLQGSAMIRGAALKALTGDSHWPPFLMDAEATYTLAADAAFNVTAHGQVRLPDQADALGPFEVTVRQATDGLHLEGLRVHTLPLSLTGAIVIGADKRWYLDAEEATLRNQGIRWLVTRVPAIPLTVTEGGAAEVAMTSARLGGDPSRGFYFEQGAIKVKDVGIRIKGDYQMDGIDGAIAVDHDVYTLSGLSNGHVEAAGTMTLGYAADSVDLNLTGKLNLSPEFPLPEAVSSLLRTEAGTVTIPEFQATFLQGNVQHSTLRVAASLVKGAVSTYDQNTRTFTPPMAVAGEGRFKEGVLHIGRIEGPHTRFTGTLTPDESLQRWSVVSSFTSDLASPFWDLLRPGMITFERGKIECTRLEGAFVRGEKKPESLLVEATVKDAVAALDTGGFNDGIHLDTVAFKSTATEVNFDGSGSSEKLGRFAAQGTFAIATGAVKSQARLRPAEAVLIPEAWRQTLGEQVLNALGDVPLTLNYAGTGSRIELASEAPLSLKGTLDVGPRAKAKAPLGLSIGATVPANWLAPHLSPSIEPAGSVKVAFEVDPVKGSISGHADFTEATMGWSLLAKKAGFPAAVSVSGAWSEQGARIASGKLEAGGERVDFTLNAGSLRVEKFSVGLTPLAPLLPEGGTLEGRVGGSYGPEGALSLDLDGVSARIAPELLPLRLDGALARTGGRWKTENLDWEIGVSQGRLQLAAGGATWQGQLSATRIHASELRQGYAAWAARRGQPREENAPPWTFSGDIAVTADALMWAEATLQNVRCTARFTPGAVQLVDLVLGHGSGQLSGVGGYISARDGNPSTLSADLAVHGVDAVLLEGLFLEKARGLAGLMNGRVALTIPLAPESPSVMNNISGDITFEGKDGTLGKAGLGSKLLGALRTTDIFRLRLPSLKDKGLTFKTISGHVAITQGVFNLDSFKLADPAYVLEGKATFDYPRDVADGGGEVQVLEGVTGMTRKIPILGEAANLVSKVFGLPIKISGTAREPSFGVGVATPVKTPKTP